MCFVYANFLNPIVPKYLVHLRRGTLIWKELHYRMGLFVLAMVFYGIVESAFSIWGSFYLLKIRK